MSICVIAPVAPLAGRAAGHRAPAAPPTLPAVRAGQLWLVELPLAGGIPAPLRPALRGVNVVIYDRPLAATVAPALAFGGYAESAQSGAPARCVGFARDGWSVARAFPAGLAVRERSRLVQDIIDQLARAKVSGRLPVAIFAAAADGIEEHLAALLDDLAAIVPRYPHDTRLTVVIEAFAAAMARPQAVVANGLAG